jgi:soluble lytic murein transglycosylase
MSSMVSQTVLVRLLLLGAAAPAGAFGAQTIAQTFQGAAPQAATPASQPSGQPAMVQPTPGQPEWEQIRNRLGTSPDAQASAAITEWRRLQQSDTLGASAYAYFITANPGWPGEDRMRKLAETTINPISYDPGQVVAYFARFPARTPAGNARNAIALSALGRMAEAKLAARAAWVGGNMSVQDEAQILSLFGSSLTTADHDARADALLWARNNGGAERILPYTSPARQPAFAARIAMQRKAPDAAMKVAATDAIGQSDSGFIAEKAMWLRDSGGSIAARTLLANRQPLAGPPANAEKWYESLLTNARAAAADSQWTFAYAIASKVDDAYAPGVQVRDRSLGERDDYTSLTWLAGTTAFYNLGKPRDAQAMFLRYATAARSPQTISKGYYWAGRAALLAGDNSAANQFFQSAAAYPDQFYGQLSLERLGLPVPAPSAVARPIQIAPAERTAFMNRSVVRAARALGSQGYWEDQTKFLRAIAASASNPQEQVLTSELAQSLNRPDLGVMVGRRSVADGVSGYGEASFPKVPVPEGHQYNWTMIHAIARQESQFDRAAVSHAGARGLMQLMPGTAREQAGKVGLSYNMSSLTADPSYNIQLGSSYFKRLLDQYGSYPLAVAAYNAGGGNVNKWIAQYGDPRMGGTDILRWIEQIPFTETRSYVQRVLENAVVYDASNPSRAIFPNAKAPLSRYLGKNIPG